MTKQPSGPDALKKKNRRNFEMVCVKMVKKQSLNLLSYLHLSSNEADQARRLFALQRDEAIEDFYQRLPQDTDSLDYSRFGCLINAVRILLEDMQNTLAYAEEELDFSKDEDLRTVLRRLPTASAVYNFISMSFMVPETIFSAANLTSEMEIFSKISSEEGEKTIADLKKFIEEQNKNNDEAFEKKTNEIHEKLQKMENVQNEIKQTIKGGLGVKAEDIMAVSTAVTEIKERMESLSQMPIGENEVAIMDLKGFQDNLSAKLEALSVEISKMAQLISGFKSSKGFADMKNVLNDINDKLKDISQDSRNEISNYDDFLSYCLQLGIPEEDVKRLFTKESDDIKKLVSSSGTQDDTNQIIAKWEQLKPSRGVKS